MLALLLIAALPSAASAAARPGQLDRAFGVNGSVTTLFDAFKTNSAFVGDGLVQQDGKIVAVADSDYDGRGELVVARFDPAGALDPSFGGDGIVATPLDGGVTATGAALQPDGRIVVVGSLRGGSTPGLTLVRYNPDGSLDGSFGGDGIVYTYAGISAAAAALQTDGMIVVAGSSASAGRRHFAVARYAADGSLDASFGAGGIVDTPFASDAAANDVAVEPDGRIVAVGAALTGSGSQAGLAIARYDPEGSPDPSFGSGGEATTAIGGNGVDGRTTSVVVQPDGKIVAAGHAFFAPATALARYNADGSLDASFGSGGIATADLGASTDPVVGHASLALQSDGKIAVALTRYSGLGVARFDRFGVLDPSFGVGGVATANFEAGGAAASGLALDPTGRPVVIGDAFRLVQPDIGGAFPTLGHFAVARFTGDGSLDPSFGEGGKALTSGGAERVGAESEATSIAGGPHGKVVVVGEAFPASDEVDAAVVRYRPDGSPDPTFGEGGRVITQRPGDGSQFVGGPAAAVGAHRGKLLVIGTASRSTALVGSAKPGFALTRYRSDGSLDPSFGRHGQVVTGSFSATAVAAVRQPNASLIVVGAAREGALVARYHPDGSIDRSFARRGKVTITRDGFSSPRGVIVEPRGRIVVGTSRGLVGLKRSGAIDRSFGDRGFVRVSAVGAVNRVLWAGRGRLLVTAGDARLTLLRYRANGAPDRSFGRRGKVVRDVVTFEGQPAAVQPNGKLIVAGEQSRHLVLTRLNRNGSRDRSFGRRGRAVAPVAGSIHVLAPIPGHRLLVAGAARATVDGQAPRLGFLLARLRR